MVNSNIERLDLFHHKCIHCGHKLVIEETNRKCTNCDALIYEKMTPVVFINLFKDCLSNLEIKQDVINAFINIRETTVSSMKICTELSQYFIDRPFEDRFGGQYKSFLINETFKSILINNFSNKD